MANRLLEKDYHKIAFEAFKLSDNDQFKYYLNELEKNYKDNNDFIIELEKSINEFKNNFFSYVVENNLFVNEQGYKKVSNTNNVYVNWPSINRRVNRLFFDEQLKIIEILKGNIALRKQVLEFENNLPEPLKTDIKKIPFRNSFELSDIKKRFELIRIKESEFNAKKTKDDTLKSHLTFKDLFKPAYQLKIDELKNILKIKGYCDNNFLWIGLTREKKELAFLYHVLNDRKYIIVNGKFEPQIQTFYKEFGLKISGTKEKDSCCTIRNLKNYTTNSATYKEFDQILEKWFIKIN